MIEVRLDAGEMAVANVLAAMRNGINRASAVSNAKVGPQSDYQADLDGLVAEIAFAKWRNVCPDLSVSPRSGSWDAVVKGQRIDIKATRYDNGKLLAVPGKAVLDSADIYVLAVVKGNAVKFPGWATADELLSEENLTDLGHGPTFAMPQERLHQFKEAK